MNRNLVAVLAKVLGLKDPEIHPDLSMRDVRGWDSLMQMDLVLTLEREYATNLQIVDIMRIESVRSVIEILKEKGVALNGKPEKMPLT
ncbi:MAG: acyl carrier protein [Magnetococcales bacterium]|nr:acyl carrier protein [Magnetococcales bacterium]